MRVAREQRKRSKKKAPNEVSARPVEPEVEALEVWHVPASAVETRQQRRARRAERRKEVAEDVPTPVELVEVSPWVPIVWFLVPLVLAIVGALIAGNP